MKKLPLVSVIITTYKKSDYLNRAIKSVLSQTYPNIELIIVDDNDSETEFRKLNEIIMAEYKNNSKVKYIKHKNNLNGAAARNTGINNVNGKYIAFLDDDDVFDKNRISIMVNELEQNKEFHGAYSNMNMIMKNNKYKLTDINICKSGNMHKEILSLEFTIGSGSNMFFRTDVVRELEGFDTRFKRHQDVEFLVRYFRNYNILYIDKILATKHMDIPILRFNSNILEEVKILFLEKFKYDIELYDDDVQNKIKSYHYKELLFCYINDMRIRESISTYLKCKEYIKLHEIKKIIIIFLKSILKNIIGVNKNRTSY